MSRNPHRKGTRLGFIVPAINVIAEDDFIAMAAPSVGVHFTRADVDTRRTVSDQFQQMVDAAPELAKTLAKSGIQACAFACTSASFFRGTNADRLLAKAMRDASGIPCVTTSSAVVDALRHLGVRRIGLATPYLSWVVDAERTFLTQEGFEVVAANGLERRGGADINTIDDETIRAQAKAVALDSADAIFISCTDLPSSALIESLESQLGRPVITSNQATYWACARAANLAPVSGFGHLLRNRLS